MENWFLLPNFLLYVYLLWRELPMTPEITGAPIVCVSTTGLNRFRKTSVHQSQVCEQKVHQADCSGHQTQPAWVSWLWVRPQACPSWLMVNPIYARLDWGRCSHLASQGIRCHTARFTPTTWSWHGADRRGHISRCVRHYDWHGGMASGVGHDFATTIFIAHRFLDKINIHQQVTCGGCPHHDRPTPLEGHSEDSVQP